MTTVIGLKSGKEFIVKEKCFSTISKVTGLVTRIFISPDEKRLITIPPEGVVEFFDEPYDPKIVKRLNDMIKAVEGEVEVSEEADPNVG